jgi:hypothetical protein
MFTLKDLLGYLPLHVEGSLINLMNESPPDRGSISRQEWDALEWGRLITLQNLHSYFAYDVHKTATDVVRSGKRFGLYLRNFDLGGRVAPETLTDSKTGVVERITDISTQDLRLARMLRDGTSLPFVAVANSAFDDWGASVARLNLRNEDWYESVVKLLGWASVIVVFVYDVESAGLRQELAAIEKAARADATLLVVPQGTDLPSKGLQQIMWDESPQQLQRLVSAIESVRQPAPLAGRTEWDPQEKMPPELLCQYFNRFAFVVMDEANELLDGGDAVAGLDSLYRGVAIASFIRNVPARAAFVGTLARVYRSLLHKQSSAQICYNLAEDLWENLVKAEPENQAYLTAFKTVQREHRDLK